MCTMPCLESDMPKYLNPKSFTFSSSLRTCVRDAVSSMNVSTERRSLREEVGTLWSTVTRVQSGRRTPR